MPSKETLEAAADEILRAHCGKPLTDIQRMILRESLVGKGYEQMAGYATQHIKNEGTALWSLLSEALGEKVGKKNFKGALENWQKAREVVKTPPALSVYNPETWVGRSGIIDELLPRLQDKTRLVWITGIPGIGKTTLGECLASRAWESNPTFQWVYLEVLEGQGADFTTIAADLLAKLGDRELDPQERNDPKRLTDRLVRKLQSSCYWVQLDSLERLLNPEQGTEFADAHWVTFLQRCLTERDFGSRLVLTAQALPSGLIEFADRYPNVWQARTLAGLSADGLHNEHLEFFGKHGVAVDDGNQATLSQVGRVYEGHTLVLQVMSGEIQADFGGDVGRYWAVNQQEFEQVARSLDAKRLDETEYNDELDRRVRDRVKRSLQQLPQDAQDLLLRSSVYRRPVPKKFWLAMIDDRSSSQQKEAYRVLCDRALVEREKAHNYYLIRQHNLVRDISYYLLRQTAKNWKIAERQAAQLWLTEYEPDPDAPKLETVRGDLEAFEHYYELEDWEMAKTILLDKQIGTQLQTWSNYKEALSYHRRLIGHLEALDEVECQRGMGNIYYFLGNYSQAIPHYQHSLELAKEIDDEQGQFKALNNLGNVLQGLGRHVESINYFQQTLTLARESNNRQGEGNALGNLGIAHYRLGQYEQAINYHQQYLTIAKETSNRRDEGNALGNLGNAYNSLGRYERAIEYLEQQLICTQEIGDRRGEGNARGSLGLTYYSLGQYNLAIDYHQQYLTIAREIGDRSGEALSLGNLGSAYRALGDYFKSLELQKQKLAIVRELRRRTSEGYALSALGEVLIKLKQYPDALKALQDALEICKETGERSLEAETLRNSAELHQALGEDEVARQYCQQALALATELGIPLADECRKLQEEIENSTSVSSG